MSALRGLLYSLMVIVVGAQFAFVLDFRAFGEPIVASLGVKDHADGVMFSKYVAPSSAPFNTNVHFPLCDVIEKFGADFIVAPNQESLLGSTSRDYLRTASEFIGAGVTYAINSRKNGVRGHFDIQGRRGAFVLKFENGVKPVSIHCERTTFAGQIGAHLSLTDVAGCADSIFRRFGTSWDCPGFVDTEIAFA